MKKYFSLTSLFLVSGSKVSSIILDTTFSVVSVSTAGLYPRELVKAVSSEVISAKSVKKNLKSQHTSRNKGVEIGKR